MQQYFVEQPLVLQQEQQLTNDQCHHILHVMRMRSGDVVRLADDSGAVMLAELRVQEGRVWALPTSIVPAAQEMCIRDSCTDVRMVIVTFLSLLDLIKQRIVHFHIDEEEMIWIIKGEDSYEAVAGSD